MTERRAGVGAPPLTDGAAHVWSVTSPAGSDSVARVIAAYGLAAEGPPVILRDAAKPHLGGWGADLRFNVSRTRGLVLVAVARGREIGVDVERLGQTRQWSLPLHVLTPRERSSLERAPGRSAAAAFLCLWARKEAVLKAAGVGLAVEPVLVEVSGADEPAEILRLPDSIGPAARYRLVDLDVPGCAAALAVERPLGPVTVLQAGSSHLFTKSLPVGDAALTVRL